MADIKNYLAIDLGAESGRAMIGALDGETLSLTEVHRFANNPVRLPDGLHWDVLRLWAEIKAGISMAGLKCDNRLEGIGLDTWGVDFALLDENGSLLGNPFHYRDSRTDGVLDEAFRLISRKAIFENTGIQFMQINSLYQLFSMVLHKSPLFGIAQTFVTIPDLFNYWLSGQVTCEFTNATTTQCYDPRRRDWSWPVLETLGIPKHLFRPVTQPGTRLGLLLPAVAEETGVADIPVIAPACHDTGSAVVAVPAEKEHYAWISSGTWSILGCEVSQPCVTPQALAYNFTNEGGVFGAWRLSKNIIGLWLVQECRRSWASAGEVLTYDEITQLAAVARPFLAVIDPDDATFLHPGDMPERIREFCQASGQSIPQTKGEIVRVALESIALKYRLTLERLEELTGYRLEPLHIIGGGIKNRLLSQFTSDATGRTVIAGPIEATAIGNTLIQAITSGQLGSLDEARSIVRHSFSPQIFQPAPSAPWDEAYERLLEVMDNHG
jgi:rhamnulokinase